MSRNKPNPENMFPEEVLKLRDEHGIVLPTWYSGPLLPLPSIETMEKAMNMLQKVREEAGSGNKNSEEEPIQF